MIFVQSVILYFKNVNIVSKSLGRFLNIFVGSTRDFEDNMSSTNCQEMLKNDGAMASTQDIHTRIAKIILN